MRPFRIKLIQIVYFALAFSVQIHAQSDGFSTTTEGGRGLMYMQSARTYGKAKMTFGIKTIVMEKKSPVYDEINSRIRTRTDFPTVMAVPITFGLTDEIDLNLSVYGFRDTRTLVSKEDIRLGYSDVVQGIGSTLLGVKIRLPFKEESRLQIAGKFSAMLDTSEDEADGMNYRWSRMGTDILASLYQSYDLFSFMTIIFEEGYVLSGSKLYDDQVVGGAGVQFRIKSRCNINFEVNNRTFLGIGPQSTSQALDYPGSFETVNGVPGIGNTSLLKDEESDYWEDFYIFSPSIDIRMTKNIALNLGVNYNLADQVAPKESYQMVVGLTFNKIFTSLIDSDEDGITDNVDMELHTHRGYPVDERGVSLDTDLDGVADGKDREPNTPPGAKTNAAGVGIDSDRDGVFDGIDLEPDTPEGASVTRFGVAIDDDRDGVPNVFDREPDTRIGAVVDEAGRSLDSDGDTVPDGIDMESDTRKGAVIDTLGVSIDSDSDGVPDGIDEEPDTPRGLLVDKRGRGLVKHEVDLFRDGLIRITTIQFHEGSAVLNPESHPALDEIGQILIKYGKLRIQIEGHTDSTGDNKNNLRLSRDRAMAVRDYILNHFPQIDQKRLRAVGFGSDKPFAPNTTAKGRKENRRVEFIIIDREEILKQ